MQQIMDTQTIQLPVEIFKEILLGNAWYRPFPKDSIIPQLVVDYPNLFKIIESPTAIEVWDNDAWYIQAQIKAKRILEAQNSLEVVKEELANLQIKLDATVELLGVEGFQDILRASISKGFKPTELTSLEVQKILKYITTGELKYDQG